MVPELLSFIGSKLTVACILKKKKKRIFMQQLKFIEKKNKAHKGGGGGGFATVINQMWYDYKLSHNDFLSNIL